MFAPRKIILKAGRDVYMASCNEKYMAMPACLPDVYLCIWLGILSRRCFTIPKPARAFSIATIDLLYITTSSLVYITHKHTHILYTISAVYALVCVSVLCWGYVTGIVVRPAKQSTYTPCGPTTPSAPHGTAEPLECELGGVLEIV